MGSNAGATGGPKIRVRQFASEKAIYNERASPTPEPPAENNIAQAPVADDGEIILLSSDDEVKVKPSPPKRRRKPGYRSGGRISGRIPKALQEGCHKITEYFGVTKAEKTSVTNIDSAIAGPTNQPSPVAKSELPSTEIKELNYIPEAAANSDDDDIAIKTIKTRPRKRRANVIRDTESEMTTDNNQTDSPLLLPIEDDQNVPETTINLIKVRKQKGKATGAAEKISKGTKDKTKATAKKNPTIKVVKTREKGATVTKELRVVLKRLDVIKRFDDTGEQNEPDPLPQQAILTSYLADGSDQVASAEYFAVHKESAVALPMPMVLIPSPNRASIPQVPVKMELTSIVKTEEIENECKMPRPTAVSKPSRGARAKAVCPSYKIVEGTNFAVDAFRYGNIDGVKHYFLTHYHADHYIGLKKSFSHELYASEITGRLVIELIKVPAKRVRMMRLGEPTVVDGVEVTALEANHCPGAVMLLFKLFSGRCILHTGDFRADPSMEEYPEFWSNNIDVVYLDTTYLSKNYAFCTQNESIQNVLLDCDSYLQQNIDGNGRTLIVCGAYAIGKEKVWLSIAQQYNYKVYVTKERRRALECIGNRDMLDVLVDSPVEANIHVLPIREIQYPRLVEYLNMYGEQFTRLLAFRPSGWEKSTKPSLKSRVTVVGVQYSEHSSYDELHRFVCYLKPSRVISTVPISAKNQEKTAKIPQTWLDCAIQPLRPSYQSNIKDYMRPKARVLPKQPTNSAVGQANDAINAESLALDDSDSDYML